MEIYFITTSYSSQIYFIITLYMKYGWLWWRILDTGILYCYLTYPGLKCPHSRVRSPPTTPRCSASSRGSSGWSCRRRAVCRGDNMIMIMLMEMMMMMLSGVWTVWPSSTWTMTEQWSSRPSPRWLSSLAAADSVVLQYEYWNKQMFVVLWKPMVTCGMCLSLKSTKRRRLY